MLTIGDIADRIALPYEDKKAVRKRLTNWAKEGLLDYFGAKQPGSGAHRRFEHKTLIDAAVLSALGDLGIPAVRALTLGGTERTMFFHCRLAATNWRARFAAGETLYLVIVKALGSDGAPVGQASVQIQSGLSLPEPAVMPQPYRALRSDTDVHVPGWADASVVVNLTKLFSRIDYSPES